MISAFIPVPVATRYLSHQCLKFCNGRYFLICPRFVGFVGTGFWQWGTDYVQRVGESSRTLLSSSLCPQRNSGPWRWDFLLPSHQSHPVSFIFSPERNRKKKAVTPGSRWKVSGGRLLTPTLELSRQTWSSCLAYHHGLLTRTCWKGRIILENLERSWGLKSTMAPAPRIYPHDARSDLFLIFHLMKSRIICKGSKCDGLRDVCKSRGCTDCYPLSDGHLGWWQNR